MRATSLGTASAICPGLGIEVSEARLIDRTGSRRSRRRAKKGFQRVFTIDTENFPNFQTEFDRV